ncbi:hypothetical protein AC1031_009846 [Aphanomyces cochlioides]|nr:hypothetical protein AC1031_009846 [Aphanomyces cochlioides]
MALFAQYAAIGVVLSMLPALQYPIFNNYLKLEGYQTASYGQLVTLGWSFKVFFGMLSDCCPIFGYRRKSWMLIGWTVTMVCLAIMTFTSLGDPYCGRILYRSILGQGHGCRSQVLSRFFSFKLQWQSLKLPGRRQTSAQKIALTAAKRRSSEKISAGG